MTALHRVKAYFGMVPADELDAYDGYGDRRYDDRHGEDRYSGRYGDDRYGPLYSDRYPDRYEDRRYDDRYDERRYDREPEPLRDEVRGRTPRPRDPEPEIPDDAPASRPASRGRSWASNTGPNHTSVRAGSPAGGPRSSSFSSSGTSAGSSAAAASAGGPALAAVPSTPGGTESSGASAGLTRGALAVDEAARRRESRETAAAAEPVEATAPAEITTLQPKSYNEARVIGERYRDGIPVIMNLTEMDDVAAKRLVDFAAGLAFALRGSIEKVTNRVFLLSPPNVEVSAHDRRRLAENGFTGPS